MPSPVWHGATHFGFDCAVSGQSANRSQQLCQMLAPTGAETLQLPFRANPGPDGVTLRVKLRQNGARLIGTLVAVRPAFRGETDESSAVVPLSLDAVSPAADFSRALTTLRKPAQKPTAHPRVRPSA